MKALSLPFLHPLAPFGLLILRLGLGAIMVNHGWQKLQGVEGVTGFFGGLGIPAPGLMAWVVLAVELIAGICLILGLCTRVSALLLACVLLGAIATTKTLTILIGEGGFELDLAILVGLLALALVGPGRLSVDHKLGVEE